MEQEFEFNLDKVQIAKTNHDDADKMDLFDSSNNYLGTVTFKEFDKIVGPHMIKSA